MVLRTVVSTLIHLYLEPETNSTVKLYSYYGNMASPTSQEVNARFLQGEKAVNTCTPVVKKNSKKNSFFYFLKWWAKKEDVLPEVSVRFRTHFCVGHHMWVMTSLDPQWHFTCYFLIKDLYVLMPNTVRHLTRFCIVYLYFRVLKSASSIMCRGFSMGQMSRQGKAPDMAEGKTNKSQSKNHCQPISWTHTHNFVVKSSFGFAGKCILSALSIFHWFH